MPTIAELRQQRAAALDSFTALANKPTLSDAERSDYTAQRTAVTALDDQINRALDAQALAASTAQPVAGQEARATVPANLETSPYISDAAAAELSRSKGVMPGSARSINLGGMVKMIGAGNGNFDLVRSASIRTYGENHPVTRALVTSSGSAGGFILPPDYQNEVIELLRAVAVVRGANPRVIPMPRGTMVLPGQASAASASYGGEATPITTSQQSLNDITASFKKLKAMVPVSNDMMRYADPAVDAFVRDDLVKVMGLAEDYNFILSNGTAGTPMGYLYFANRWVGANAGTLGSWSTTGASVFALNAADPANTTGGNFITSTYNFTLTTIVNELAGAANRLDTANVPDSRRIWFMTPRSWNCLYNIQNSLGVYVFRDELKLGTLNGYPVKKTTQIGNNWQDASGHTNCSFIFLVEMTEDMILDSMSLELAVSREGTYVDASGTTQSAFSSDLTLVRAIAEHDHQIRHDQSVAVIQGVAWAPAVQ